MTVDIAWLGVLLAAFVGFAVNMIWFSERAFYTRWRALLGDRDTTNSASAAGMGAAFGSVTVALFVQAISVDWAMQAAAALYGHEFGVLGGLGIGAGVGIGFAAATSLGHRIFAGQGFKVWAIEVGADVLVLALMGAVLSFWR